MRVLATFVLAVCVALLATLPNFADDKEETKSVTLKGKVTCAKCDLKLEKKCTTVIVTDAKTKKEVIYYFDKASHDKFHEDVCAAPKDGTVQGTVKTEGKKKIISAKKVEY